jgi:hypothetical protein
MVGAAPTSAELTGQLMALLPNINCMELSRGNYLPDPSNHQSSKDMVSPKPLRPYAWDLYIRRLELWDLPDNFYPVFGRGCSSPMARTVAQGNRESW